MLDHNNLEAFADAQDYDHEDTSDDGVAFYAALAAETGSPVLEVACGTGRVAIPIAKLGYSVTGLDIVPGCWRGLGQNHLVCRHAGSQGMRAPSNWA